MGSNSKQTKAIRKVKAKPNKKNLKKNLERVQKIGVRIRDITLPDNITPSPCSYALSVHNSTFPEIFRPERLNKLPQRHRGKHFYTPLSSVAKKMIVR